MNNRKKLIIESIYLKETKNTTLLTADLLFETRKNTCWFEYPKEYTQYLCTERCDAFIIALLPYAMKHQYDIYSNVPISERLLYQIQNYYIPTLSKYQEDFFDITVHCITDGKNLNQFKAVGTGLSCGVDSFYTVLKHIDCGFEGFELTHLVTMNVGSFGYQGGEFSYRWFQDEVRKARLVAQKLNLPLIEINSNLMEIYQENHAASGTLRMVGAILGLQKLFSKYYISAGFDIKDFDITSEDNDDYDLFNLMIGSNESTTFYSVGVEATRFERTNYISKYPITYDTLTVCLSGNTNCGHCEKCLRTMGTLYTLGLLDKYRNSFNIDKFMKHKNYYLSKIRYFGIGYMRPLYQDIYEVMKKTDFVSYIMISCIAYLIVFPMENIKIGLKRILKKLLPPGLLNRIKEIYHVK